jgi:hypothetical protein
MKLTLLENICGFIISLAVIIDVMPHDNCIRLTAGLVNNSRQRPGRFGLFGKYTDPVNHTKSMTDKKNNKLFHAILPAII